VRFVTARPAELAALRRAVRPIYQELERDGQTRRFIARINALRAHLEAPPSSLPTCERGRAITAPGAARPVDGVYALRIAPHQLPASERLPETYGSWQIVLDRGRFRLTERSAYAHWFADGQVRVNGNEMSWKVVDADALAPQPDGVPLRRGETLDLRWQRTGGTLTLRSKRATPALAALSVMPLVRIAAAPSQQPLENTAAIQGTWVTSATAADVLAHHGDPGSIADNTGPLRLTVHGDRCRWTQHTPDGDNSGAGTCRFAGDTFEFDPAGANSTPMFLHWSVYHGRLVFHVAPGLSAESWTYHPWRNVPR
jgi:hypothetical protein